MCTKTSPLGPFNAKPMLFVALIGQVGKRLGFGRQMLRLANRQALAASDKEEAFAGYRATRHDVFVATFGKSGTNWMMQIAQQITHRGESEFERIHDVVPWPEGPGSLAVALTDTKALEQSPTGLRVIKTHLAADFVPYSEEATYLTVLRDPKEVLVSSYYFLGGLFGILSHVTIDDWFDLFTMPESMAAVWARHTASFWEWRDRSNTLILNFREMKDDLRESVRCVAAVMGVVLTESQLAKVVERSSFEYMKAHQSKFAPPRVPFVKEAERPLLVRRGKTGESGLLLSPDQQASIDRICQTELRRLGSDFPYASTFEMTASRNL
jgi:hypothetical protein